MDKPRRGKRFVIKSSTWNPEKKIPGLNLSGRSSEHYGTVAEIEFMGTLGWRHRRYGDGGEELTDTPNGRVYRRIAALRQYREARGHRKKWMRINKERTDSYIDLYIERLIRTAKLMEKIGKKREVK